MSYRDRISSHADNDRANLYAFERRSGLPHGYFDHHRMTPDGWVFVACAVIGAFLLVAGVAV
jgi:hypothetical protein